MVSDYIKTLVSQAPESDESQKYRLLDRMRTDCEYYLGNGGRCAKHLWSGNERDHIDNMKALWESFPEDKKPEWLSYEQILSYEKQMLPEKTQLQSMIQEANLRKETKHELQNQCLAEALEENDLTNVTMEMAREVVHQMGNGMLFEPLASEFRACALKDHPEWESFTEFELGTILYSDYIERLGLYNLPIHESNQKDQTPDR